MKMVSQLTRQALNRHRLLNTGSSVPCSPPDRPYPSFPQPQPPAVPPTAPEQPMPISQPPTIAPQPPRVRTVYQQLMSSHDRMTERHLRRT